MTEAQKKQIVSAIHTGGQVVIRPSSLGTLLASIGVPLLLSALTGKGLQVDRERLRRSISVHVLPNTSTITKQVSAVIPVNYRSPPFIGT